MKTENELKEHVKYKYHTIATQSTSGGCCGEGSTCETDYSFVGEDYSTQKGYQSEADLNLGCGLPVEYAGLESGMMVADLGSGAGNDVFIARQEVGETGFVIGVDMTESMNERAEINRKKLGYENVEFRLGDIEDLPLENGEVDVVISNCVLNLVPDKPKAFSEMYRVLRGGGHFCISDIVLQGELLPKMREAAELFAGCVSGAWQETDYLNLLRQTGFREIDVKKRREIQLPYSSVEKILTRQEWEEFSKSDNGIFSITVTGGKP
ncbi:MAG: arsenite methyltransferase [Balneolaceae bacterium]